MIIELEMLEFFFNLYILPAKSSFFSLLDFVAGVPKGLMLYGSVRKLNHHSYFAFNSSVF